MKARWVAGAAVLASLGFGCGEDACVNRGSTSYHDGTATWTGTLAPSGSGPAVVQVDDIVVNTGTNDCTESGVEFTVRVDSCLLWVQVTSFGDAGVRAFVEPKQTCTLPQGTITTDFQGSLYVTSKGTSALTISGSAAAGSLVWSFQGN